jgi:glycosyltransferase involved in cell wall biosynthesis
VSDRTVRLQIGRHVHPIYREQLHAVPEGWRYAYAHPALSDAAAPVKRVAERAAFLGSLREPAEAVALRVLSEGGYVHRIRPDTTEPTDLIHAAERLLWRSPVPYVVDLEHAELFVLYQRAALERPWARRLLERALLDDRLRFLLPWSEAARRSVLTAVSPETARRLEPKLRVVSPAIRPAAERPRERPAGAPLRVLFVGTVFFEKGGVEAVRAVQEARRTHDVELELVSFVPDAWQARLRDAEGITVHPPGGADFIRELYGRSDVLLFPSHMDTFGYVVLEAMAHGLPVLAPRHLALTETVVEGESGLLFDAENMLYREDTRCAFRHVLPPPRAYLEALQRPSGAYVASIAAALTALAEDRDLHARLAAGALASVRDGALSIARRRDALQAVYDAAAA